MGFSNRLPSAAPVKALEVDELRRWSIDESSVSFIFCTFWDFQVATEQNFCKEARELDGLCVVICTAFLVEAEPSDRDVGVELREGVLRQLPSDDQHVGRLLVHED